MISGRRLWPQQTLDDVLRLLGDGRSRRVLALDGRSGAGKSTLADELIAVLHPDRAALVRVENLYPGWDGLDAATGRLATEVLPALRRGEPAEYTRWDWAADRYGTVRDVVPPKLVTIVEGVGAGALAAAPLIDALVFVEAPEQLRHDRAMARDGEGFRPHWDRWAAQEEAYLARDRPRERADLVVFPGSAQGAGLA